jgi:hypothetical protein
MAILIRKTIPSSIRYTGSGDVTITFSGANNITVNTKKSLIKIPIPQSKTSQTTSASDLGKNYVVDTKRIEDTIKIRGWIEDSGTTSALSAWNKAWQLRAMSSSGGPLTTLGIENLTFSSTTASGNAAAYLEEVNFIAVPYPGKTINTVSSKGIARIEVDCSFYLGDER